MGILTALTERFTKRTESNVEAYQTLVRAAAADKPYKIEKAESVIGAMGKSFDEFSADVERLVQRIEATKTLAWCEEEKADIDAATTRVRELNKQLNAELNKVREKYNSISDRENLTERTSLTRPQTAKRMEIEARQLLQDTADDSEIDSAVEAVKVRVRQLNKRINSLKHKVEARTLSATQLRAANRIDEAMKLEREISEMRAELQTASTTERQAIQDELATIQEKRLVA